MCAHNVAIPPRSTRIREIQTPSRDDREVGVTRGGGLGAAIGGAVKCDGGGCDGLRWTLARVEF